VPPPVFYAYGLTGELRQDDNSRRTLEHRASELWHMLFIRPLMDFGRI